MRWAGAIATSYGTFQYRGVEYSHLQLESCGGTTFAHLIIQVSGIQEDPRPAGGRRLGLGVVSVKRGRRRRAVAEVGREGREAGDAADEEDGTEGAINNGVLRQNCGMFVKLMWKCVIASKCYL